MGSQSLQGTGVEILAFSDSNILHFHLLFLYCSIKKKTCTKKLCKTYAYLQFTYLTHELAK